MRNKRFIASIWIISVFLFCACGKSGSAVEPVLREMARPAWNGREVGTGGNAEAAEYLAGLLEGYGYIPFNSDSLLQPYKQTLPDISAAPAMKIIAADSESEVLRPGIDFVINRGYSGFSVSGEIVPATFFI